MKIDSQQKKRIATALTALVLMLAPFLFVGPAYAQTSIPPPGADLPIDNTNPNLSTGAAATQQTDPSAPYDNAIQQTTLIQQAAEQNTQGVITNTNNQLLQGSELGQFNDVYDGVEKFWSDDIVSNLFQNIGQLIGRWVTELINGWVSDTVQFLTAFLRTFVLNPNIAVNGLGQNPNGANGSGQNDDISPYIRQGADVMYGIAVDLLLLLFILAIWKYWVDAAWRGGVNIMGAVGRLIATAALMLAWPTIYAFEIQITNEMIKAIFFNSTDQVAMLDAAMASAVKGGLVAGVGLLANAFAPVIGQLAGGAAAASGGGMVLGTVGGIVAFAGLIIYLILGAVLIAELVYIIVLKAIQTALLTAQYMFAPIFIVFFATPDTENVCSGFVRSFVEVSLWTFVWVGLLKIMVIILFSDFNPWGKIVMAIGVLQLMIQVPSFLARAQISPASDFISAGMISGGLQKGLGALGSLAATKTGQGVDYLMNQRFAARGLAQSERAQLNNLPNTAADQGLLNGIRKGANGQTPPIVPPGSPNARPPKPGAPGNPAGQPLKGPQGPHKPGDKDKAKIDPATGKPINPTKPKIDPVTGKPIKPTTGAGAPGPRRPGGAGLPGATATKPVVPGAPGTKPTVPGALGSSSTTAGKTGTGTGTAQSTTGAAAGAMQRLGHGAKLGAAVAGGAAAVAALGAMPHKRSDAEESERERKSRQAREQAESALYNAQQENSSLKHDHDKPDDEKRKKARELALQGLRSGQLKTAQSLAGAADKKETGASGGGAAGGAANVKTTAAKGKAPASAGTGAGGAGGGAGGGADPKLQVPTAADKNQPRKPGSEGSPRAGIEPKLTIGAVPIPGTPTRQKEKEKNKETAETLTAEEQHAPTLDTDTSKDKDKDKSKVQPGVGKGTAANLKTEVGGLTSNVPSPPAAKPKIPMGSQAPTKKGAADPAGKVESTTSIGAPKLGGVGRTAPAAPAQAIKTPESGAAKNVGGRVLGGEQPRNGRGQTQMSEQEQEQQSSEELLKGAAESLRMGTVIRPVIPMGTRAGQEMKGPDVKGVKSTTTGGGTSTVKSTGSGGTSSGGTSVGSSTVGKSAPLAGGAKGPALVSTPFGPQVKLGSGARQTHFSSERAMHTAQSMEQLEEGNLITSLDANGQPVQIRVNSRMNQTTHAGNSGRTVQSLASGGTQQVNRQGGSTAGGGVAAGPAPKADVRVGANNISGGGNTGTRANLAGSTLNSMAVTQGRYLDPSTTQSVPDQVQVNDAGGAGADPPPAKPGGGAAPPQLPFDKYRQSNYRWVPPRNLAIDIRTAQGPTMGPSADGKPTIVGDGKGHVNHVRFGANASGEQKALQVIAAGYAQTFSSDSEAFDAARSSAIDAGEDAPKGAVERMAAGYMAANGKSFKQTAVAKQRFQKSMFKHAVLGSEAYVNGQDGNAFTEYLKNRYGEMTPEQQAWGIHIMTDDSSPESGWSPKVGPATDTLGGAGIPVTAGYRAAAANPSVLKQPAWGRGPAIRGVKAYAGSIVKSQCSPGTNMMVQDAMIGTVAQNVGSPEVGACLAIMLESPSVQAGETACEDRGMVQSVAQLVSDGKQKDYVSAYRSMKAIVNLVGPPSSSGGGSRSTSQSMSMQGGSSGGGTVQTINDGLSIGGQSSSSGGGFMGSQTNMVDVNVAPRGGGSFNAAPPPPPAAGFGGAQVRTQTEYNYRSTVGGSAPITNRVEMDVTGRITNNVGGGIPSIPTNLVPPTQQQVRQQLDINIRGTVGNSDISGGRTSVDMPVSGGNTVNGGTDVRVTGGGGSSQNTVTSHSVADVYTKAQGSGADMSGAASRDIGAAAAAAAGSSKSNVYVAQQVIMDMHTAGFTDDQIQDPRIAASALDVYRHDASMLGTAAVTAKIMGPQEFNRQSTTVVQAMVDAGWSANRISRPDVYTASAIMANGGGNPTPDYVQVVRVMPQYSPRPNGSLPTDFASEMARQQKNGNREDYIRNLRSGKAMS